VDGITFASKREAGRYFDLKQMERLGEISELSLQPRFVLQAPFSNEGKTERAIVYVADFKYKKGGKIFIEDVKGVKTEAYLIKRKMFLYKFGELMTFREIT
jgi:hypothetical protein